MAGRPLRATNDVDWAWNRAVDEPEFSCVRGLGGHVFSVAKRHWLPNTIKILPENPAHAPRITGVIERRTGLRSDDERIVVLRPGAYSAS